jgi:hypothetical protein
MSAASLKVYDNEGQFHGDPNANPYDPNDPNSVHTGDMGVPIHRVDNPYG